jgi:hypothetical protein
MDPINSIDIQKLDRCLISGNPILFTGAGFSMGATNDNKEEIPSGNELKKQIIEEYLGMDNSQMEYSELVKASLADVCTYASNISSEYKLRDFIVSHLSGFYPKAYQEDLLAFSKWHKIYTVNIDDVVENSKSGNRFIIQNTHRKIDYTKANKTEYIKLHGCVRNVDGRIVFSDSQYVDSMLHSTDYRFSSFAQDMQVENFVIVGTEMNEINLDYYLGLFSLSSSKTTHGQLFFINPNPSLLFKARVQKIGAVVIPWTTEEFASHITSLNQPSIAILGNVVIKDFLNVRNKYNSEKGFVDYKSNLYFGDYPKYKDVVFDWDFINPEIVNIISYIKSINTTNSARKMVALYGKALVGKSLYLKRIAISLLNEDFAVYEFCGKEFDIKYFAKCIKNIADTNIALIIDDASFYYREIASLMRVFPFEKNLVVVTASRSYQHFRKRYCLVSESWFEELFVSGETKDDEFAVNIAERLDEKGLLGKLKANEKGERIFKIKGYNDVSSFLYSITNGRYYQERMIRNYSRLSANSSLEHDFLIQLAIFYKLNLPYFPAEVFRLIYCDNSQKIINNVEHYVTFFPDHNGYAIRSPFLVPYVLKGISYKKKVRLLAEVLVYISPQIVDGYHSYWNEIASTLMKCKLLRHLLNLTNAWVKRLLSSIKNYYNDDYNYWLQVGLSEQYDNEFEHALNHFQQAESLSPNSYLVKNAIARNFLRQANIIEGKDKADLLFNEGVKRMENLIKEREEFQVRAYSTHCLLFEEIRYFRKYDIIPDDDALKEMYKSLNSILDKNPDDPMSRHISNMFLKFISDKNLNGKLPKMTLQDLGMIRVVVSGSDMSEKDMLENFELEE